MQYTLYPGDIVEFLRSIPDNTYTASYGDAPYMLTDNVDVPAMLSAWMAGDDYQANGKGFMGMDWDNYIPGPSLWNEVYRTMKPGGYLAVFSGRNADLQSVAIRLSGFEKVTSVFWIYGTGKPVSRNMANDIDESWDDYGTALKASHEEIMLFRKPIAGTYAESVSRHNAGALNIGGTRMPMGEYETIHIPKSNPDNRAGVVGSKHFTGSRGNAEKMQAAQAASIARMIELGRWPTNLIIDPYIASIINGQVPGATKVFYCAKPNAYEKDFGLDDFEVQMIGDGRDKAIDNMFQRGKTGRRNTHTTVKPISVAHWIASLLIPPVAHREDAAILIPFGGSGSDPIGAMLAGWPRIDAAEIVPEYVEINESRFRAWHNQMMAMRCISVPLFEKKKKAEQTVAQKIEQIAMF